MTDTPSSPTDPADDDLLASLYLDGEATEDERSQVEADPALMARVEAFQAIAADLSNVAPPPDLGRMQISAALDLFDQQHAPAAAPETTPPVSPAGVTSLAERRERKQSKGIPSWLGVAAAGALVVGGLGFASTLGGGDDDASTTDAAMESSEELSASAASRVQDEATATTAADSAESFASDDAMEESDEMDAMEEETASEDAAAPEADSTDEDSADEESADDAAAGDDAGEDASEVAETGPSPVPLDGLEADTAAGYLALLSDQPLQPIDNSPCAGSPLVDGLFGVDSFIPVVFDGVVSSLLVQEGVPSTAVIVGPTCEIELQ